MYADSREMLKIVVHHSMLNLLHVECQYSAHSKDINYLKTHRSFRIKYIKTKDKVDCFSTPFLGNICAFCLMLVFGSSFFIRESETETILVI